VAHKGTLAVPDDLKRKMVLDGPKNGRCSYGIRPAM
jgi:hypothetical protein